MDRELIARPDARRPTLYVLSVAGEATARQDPGETGVVSGQQRDDLAHGRPALGDVDIDPGPSHGFPGCREQEDLQASIHGPC